MIVQVRDDELVLIRQHDHGIASGVFAHEWIGLDGNGRAPFDVVLAAALHDFAWLEVDERPHFDAERRAPLDFERHPTGPKYAFYERGLDAVERISPYSALLGSLHYAAFAMDRGIPGFLQRESARRERLRASLELGPPHDAVIELDRALVRLFDNLSLFVCLRSPDVRNQPAWLAPEVVGVDPGGNSFALRWVESTVLAVDPFPFGRAFPLGIPARHLPPGPYDTPHSLDEAWEAGRHSTLVVEIVPARG